MRNCDLIIAAKVIVAVLTFSLETNEARGQDGIDIPITLSVHPTPATPNDEVQLNFSVPNLGIGVGATFAPEIELNGNSLLVKLVYDAPEIPPGGLHLPSAFSPEGTISLGMLGQGNYQVTALLQGRDAPALAAGHTSFNVVPEPNSALIFMFAVFSFAFSRIRMARCLS